MYVTGFLGHTAHDYLGPRLAFGLEAEMHFVRLKVTAYRTCAVAATEERGVCSA